MAGNPGQVARDLFVVRLFPLERARLLKIQPGGKKASTITSPSRAKPVLFISNLPVCTSQRKTRIPPLFLKKS